MGNSPSQSEFFAPPVGTADAEGGGGGCPHNNNGALIVRACPSGPVQVFEPPPLIHQLHQVEQVGSGGGASEEEDTPHLISSSGPSSHANQLQDHHHHHPPSPSNIIFIHQKTRMETEELTQSPPPPPPPQEKVAEANNNEILLTTHTHVVARRDTLFHDEKEESPLSEGGGETRRRRRRRMNNNKSVGTQWSPPPKKEEEGGGGLSATPTSFPPSSPSSSGVTPYYTPKEYLSPIKSDGIQGGREHPVEELWAMLQQLKNDQNRIESGEEERSLALIRERDLALEDLRNVESAFSDLHKKYERSKTLLQNLKENELLFANRDQEMMKMVEMQERKMEMYKEVAQKKLEEMHQDYEARIRELEGENNRLKAQCRLMEMKLEPLEHEARQKSEEIVKLRALCDELIHGQSPP